MNDGYCGHHNDGGRYPDRDDGPPEMASGTVGTETKKEAMGFEYSDLFTDLRFSGYDRSDTIRRLGRTARERSEKITLHAGDPYGNHVVVFRDDMRPGTTIVPAFATESMGELGVFLSGWREGQFANPFTGVGMVPSSIADCETILMPVRPRYHQKGQRLHFARGEHRDLMFSLGEDGKWYSLPIDLYASPMNRVRVEVEWILERMGTLDVAIDGSPFIDGEGPA